MIISCLKLSHLLSHWKGNLFSQVSLGCNFKQCLHCWEVYTDLAKISMLENDWMNVKYVCMLFYPFTWCFEVCLFYTTIEFLNNCKIVHYKRFLHKQYLEPNNWAGQCLTQKGAVREPANNRRKVDVAVQKKI